MPGGVDQFSLYTTVLQDSGTLLRSRMNSSISDANHRWNLQWENGLATIPTNKAPAFHPPSTGWAGFYLFHHDCSCCLFWTSRAEWRISIQGCCWHAANLLQCVGCIYLFIASFLGSTFCSQPAFFSASLPGRSVCWHCCNFASGITVKTIKMKSSAILS